jgi:hypothetical protein
VTTALSDPVGLDVPFHPRGPLSAAILSAPSGPGTDVELLSLAQRLCIQADDPLTDDDIQLSLFCLYAASYGLFPGVSPDREWDPGLVAVRRVLESAVESALRVRLADVPIPEPRRDAVAAALFELTSVDEGPSLSRFIAKKCTRDHVREFLIHRSVYTLREADPHSWAIPRLTGAAKAALVEIQSDEYGGGQPDRVHAAVFAKAMRGAGLDDEYGHYLDAVPAVTLASFTAMSMFGLNGRLLGAIVGHLAAFEMTSSIPNRLYGDGLRRLGYDDDVLDYFDEHVEADAVHEQIAGRDLAGSLAEQRPDLVPDIMFGASACLALDGAVGSHMLECWAGSASSLRDGGLYA